MFRGLWIYIPLWYLLIKLTECSTYAIYSYLHSTMVSINHGRRRFERSDLRIYIPLWYLLIPERQEYARYWYDIYIPLWYLLIHLFASSSASFRDLHSTMVSINRHTITTPRKYTCIYIPLWYLLILDPRFFQPQKLSYLHSTMVSINLAFKPKLKCAAPIYIPLWYLLILCPDEREAFH